MYRAPCQLTCSNPSLEGLSSESTRALERRDLYGAGSPQRSLGVAPQATTQHAGPKKPQKDMARRLR